ncbi:hypothetical protein ABW19_dt0204520 [Dactylella cylindrospora]|nr:hypothetical protein ABW19_dt0204520 [Dactylella cylindrospora]
MLMGKDAYERSWKHAQKLMRAGRGNEIMPPRLLANLLSAPCNASRWYSLTSPLFDGPDDFFSSDLPLENLEQTFGRITPSSTPLLILYSGADEYTPPEVDKKAMVGRWMDVCRRFGVNVDTVNGGVLEGATHNLEGCGDGVKREFLGRLGRFLKGVAGEEGGERKIVINGVL